MRYLNVTNLTWANSSKSLLNCMVEFEGIGFIPFTAKMDDAEAHSREIFAEALNGTFGEIADFIPPPPPRITKEDIVNERSRRLSLGFDFDFQDERGVHRIGTTDQDMRGWDEVTKGAQAAINLGQPDTTLQIVTNTGPVTVTAMEWQQILAAATQARQPIYSASFALQMMDPIPSDYADDSYWP